MHLTSWLSLTDAIVADCISSFLSLVVMASMEGMAAGITNVVTQLTEMRSSQTTTQEIANLVNTSEGNVLAAVEHQLSGVTDSFRAMLGPIVSKVEVMENNFGQLAETVAAMQAEIKLLQHAHNALREVPDAWKGQTLGQAHQPTLERNTKRKFSAYGYGAHSSSSAGPARAESPQPTFGEYTQLVICGFGRSLTKSAMIKVVDDIIVHVRHDLEDLKESCKFVYKDKLCELHFETNALALELLKEFRAMEEKWLTWQDKRNPEHLKLQVLYIKFAAAYETRVNNICQNQLWHALKDYTDSLPPLEGSDLNRFSKVVPRHGKYIFLEYNNDLFPICSFGNFGEEAQEFLSVEQHPDYDPAELQLIGATVEGMDACMRGAKAKAEALFAAQRKKRR